MSVEDKGSLESIRVREPIKGCRGFVGDTALLNVPMSDVNLPKYRLAAIGLSCTLYRSPKRAVNSKVLTSWEGSEISCQRGGLGSTVRMSMKTVEGSEPPSSCPPPIRPSFTAHTGNRCVAFHSSAHTLYEQEFKTIWNFQ